MVLTMLGTTTKKMDTAAMNFVNEREIMINALQRSGHHAFVDWIVNNCQGHLFLNCVTDDRFFRPTFIAGKPEARFLNDLSLSVEREAAGDLTRKELILYNMESHSTQQALDVFRSPRKEERIGRSRNAYFVVWLRDPFNNLASQSNRGKRALEVTSNSRHEERLDRLKFSRDLWVDHFQAYKQALAGENSFVAACYNQWLSDERFRDQLAIRFNIATRYNADRIVGWGSGSSFAPYQEGQAAPSKQELESRWQEVKDLPAYRDLFRDERFRDAVIEFREFYRSAELDQAYSELLA